MHLPQPSSLAECVVEVFCNQLPCTDFSVFGVLIQAWSCQHYWEQARRVLAQSVLVLRPLGLSETNTQIRRRCEKTWGPSLLQSVTNAVFCYFLRVALRSPDLQKPAWAYNSLWFMNKILMDAWENEAAHEANDDMKMQYTRKRSTGNSNQH